MNANLQQIITLQNFIEELLLFFIYIHFEKNLKYCLLHVNFKLIK